MEVILKEWLIRRLNIQTQWDTDLGSQLKNGYIIASILYNYNIINDEKNSLMLNSYESKHIKSNWILIREWLRNVGIILTEEEVESARKGSKPIILRLLYQLFLYLDKKDRSDFIKQERKMASTLVDNENRFIVTAANIYKNFIEDNLDKPLLNEKIFIDWQRKKADEVKEMYKQAKQYIIKSEKPLEPIVDHFVTKSLDQNKKDMDKFNLKYPTVFKNYTYEELVALENRTKENKNIVGTEWAKEYINNLINRMNKKSDAEEFQKQIIQSITNTTWNSFIEESECNRDAELANEVMKLSQFEKQMCTQIMETKQQMRNLVKNRILAETEFAYQRELQFNVFIDSVKDDINSGLLEINLESQRIQTLHERLFAERMKRKRKLYYEICYDTVLSIVDYALKYSYYKGLMGDIPEKFIHEWKLLYFKQQPIFDILTPIDSFVIKDSANEIEEIKCLSLEKVRQECLNESEFTEYIDYLNSWKLDVLLANYDPESEERNYERMGNNILTHVIYTLLELKYPLPPKRQPVNLPCYESKSLVINVPSMSIDSAMQTLLNKRKILVLRVESCVDFCLGQYKTEMTGSVEISLAFEKLAENNKEESTKGLLKNLISYRKIYSSKSDTSLTTLDNNNKQTQTPKALPEEDIVLSKSAYLGKQAFKTLSSGDSLSNDLITNMIAEYIKEQKDIKGFVILNYPNTYGEARILEEIFSGKIPPDESEYDCITESLIQDRVETHDNDNNEDPLKKYRKSKILKFDKISPEDIFTTYFTSYIKLTKTDKIEKEFFIWDLTKENSDAIDRFYSAEGINYSMFYENIDKTQLALICRNVIGDYGFPLKSNDELFGINVLDELEFPAPENRKYKTKVIKTENSSSKTTKQKKDANQKNSSISNSAPVDTNTIHENVSEEDLKDTTIQQPTSRRSSTFTHNITWKDADKILAGDDNWEFSKLQITDKTGLVLASCWEEIEKSYINDVQQLLLSKRLQMHCLVPYTAFISDKMKQIVMLPSSKQDLVSKFQQEYNKLDDDWRENIVTKNEWHCRVKELQNKLFDVCDERKKYSEQQKHYLISENWICDELIILANTYVSLMQSEVNRFILTYQILHDYYITVVNKSLSQRLPLKELNKFVRDTNEIAGIIKTKSSEEKYRQLKEAFLELQLENIRIDNHNNPLNVFIDDNTKLAIRNVQEISESYKTLVGYETNDLVQKFQNASSSSLKKKLQKDSKIVGEPVEARRFEYLKCMEEWKMGCVGETSRVNLRLTILQKKCYEDMQLFCDQLFNVYNNIQNYIDYQYLREIKSVDRLCKYIQMAIELHQKIPENLLLEEESFVIDPNVLQMPVPLYAESEKIEEITGEMEFKLSQLALLREMFKIVAPTGIAIQQAFIYSIQDFVMFGKESCKDPIFPLMWRRINPDRIPEFVFSVFGDNLYIDWRDFLIYCMNIPLPTADEIIETQKKLRCQETESKELISREIFLNTPLWFEKQFDSDNKTLQLRNTLQKHFLFELFEVSKDIMNYTGLLLAFCKGKDPKEGFSKALALALGKRVCYLRECEEAVNKLIEDKKMKEEAHDQACKDINTFLDLILHTVLDHCAGTTIIELKDNVTNRRKGKGRMSGRSKTSARSSHMGVNEKMSSTGKSEVKMIFINSQVKDESGGEYISENLKQQKEEKLVANSDITYSVSRSTIWKVLDVCVPWHFDQTESPYKAVIEKTIDQLEQDTDDKSIYVCKFLSEPKICKFLHKIKKFSAPNMHEEILKILEE